MELPSERSRSRSLSSGLPTEGDKLVLKTPNFRRVLERDGTFETFSRDRNPDWRWRLIWRGGTRRMKFVAAICVRAQGGKGHALAVQEDFNRCVLQGIAAQIRHDAAAAVVERAMQTHQENTTEQVA